MKVDRCEGQVQCQVSARRLWRAGFQDAHHCLPRALPSVVDRMDYDDGAPFEPGSVRTLHYHLNYALRVSRENNLKHLVRYMKDKILEVDHDLLRLKIEVLDGGFLDILVRSYSYVIQIMEGPQPDTCVAHWSFEFTAISPKHKLMMLARVKEVVPLSFKSVENYLLQNDEYKD